MAVLAFISFAFLLTFYPSFSSALDECASTDLSIGSPTEEVFCGKYVEFLLVPDAAGESESVTDNPSLDESNAVVFTLDTPVEFNVFGLCPNIQGPKSCDTFKVSFASASDALDGSPIEIDGTGYSGMAHWICADEEGNTYNYYFLINFDGSDTITGKSLIKKIINEEDTTGEDPTVLIPGEFNKFEEVNSGTNIYYWKTGPADYHYVFDQGEAIISLIEYDQLAAGSVAQTAAPVCTNAVKLCFTEDCEVQYCRDLSSSSGGPGSSNGSSGGSCNSAYQIFPASVIAANIPIMVTLFINVGYPWI